MISLLEKDILLGEDACHQVNGCHQRRRGKSLYKYYRLVPKTLSIHVI